MVSEEASSLHFYYRLFSEILPLYQKAIFWIPWVSKFFVNKEECRERKKYIFCARTNLPYHRWLFQSFSVSKYAEFIKKKVYQIHDYSMTNIELSALWDIHLATFHHRWGNQESIRRVSTYPPPITLDFLAEWLILRIW